MYVFCLLAIFSRIYAELVHVKNEFNSLLTNETGAKFGYCRNPQTTAGFIKQFYKEVQVPPQEVEYVEAYGTGKCKNNLSTMIDDAWIEQRRALVA